MHMLCCDLHLPPAPSFDWNAIIAIVWCILKNQKKNVASLSWLFFLTWTIVGIRCGAFLHFPAGVPPCRRAPWWLTRFLCDDLRSTCVRNFTRAWNLGSFCQFDSGSGVDFNFPCVRACVRAFRGKYTAQFGINIYCLFSHFQPFYPPSLLSLCSWEAAAASILAAAERKTLILLINSLA